MKTLYSWIGHADLKSYYNNEQAFQYRNRIQRIIGQEKVLSESSTLGPIETAIHHSEYARIVLLWSYSDTILLSAYQKFLGANCHAITVRVNNPIDYAEIYDIVDNLLQSEDSSSDNERVMLLSSGTPVMTAIWLLLGKTKYPASFLQVYNGKVIPTDLPFDIRVDVIHKLLTNNDKNINGISDDMLMDNSGFQSIVGESQAIQMAVTRGKMVALHDVNVLLTGESGTGKEMFARAIHLAGHRHNKQFIAVNCGAFSEQLLASELFGYKKGAFTGANADKAGLFKQADGGTLFLDEIGECSLEMQKTLLRVLQPPAEKPFTYREFMPIGGTETIHADVRIIAATNKDLLSISNAGQFRLDLYYRLATTAICLPSLRERGKDVVLLAERLLDRINKELGKRPVYITKHLSIDAINAIEKNKWPGNVRELLNVITQGAVMALGDTIHPEDLGLHMDEKMNEVAVEEENDNGNSTEEELNLDLAVCNLKKRLIHKAIEESGKSKSIAYKLLGMKSYQRLDSMMKSLGMKMEFDE